jgi:hypothetical protein
MRPMLPEARFLSFSARSIMTSNNGAKMPQLPILESWQAYRLITRNLPSKGVISRSTLTN